MTELLKRAPAFCYRRLTRALIRPHGGLPAQIHRIYSFFPPCLASFLLPPGAAFFFLFSITGIKQNSSLPRDRSLASTHQDSTVKARMFLSLCGNACTVSSVDLLPFLASTRCSEPCGNYSDLHPSMEGCPLPMPFWASLLLALARSPQHHVLSPLGTLLKYSS